MERRRRFARNPASVGEARRFLAEVLGEWGLGDLEGPAVLALSELVTNAVLHGRADVEVVVLARSGGLRVEVYDPSQTMPKRKSYGSDASTGRGLQIVDALASRWGTDVTPSGKSVWFEMAAGSDADGKGPGAASRNSPGVARAQGTRGAGPAEGRDRPGEGVTGRAWATEARAGRRWTPSPSPQRTGGWRAVA